MEYVSAELLHKPRRLKTDWLLPSVGSRRRTIQLHLEKSDWKRPISFKMAKMWPHKSLGHVTVPVLHRWPPSWTLRFSHDQIFKKSYHLFSQLTCFLKSSAWGAKAAGSASRMNCITSSMDQDEGFLLGSCRPSLSDPGASGPVVELAAAETNLKQSDDSLLFSHTCPPHYRKWSVSEWLSKLEILCLV